MPLYSHSRLGTYENCPFQYKLRYVDRVKPILGNTIESFMGSMVHDALEWLYKLAQDSNILRGYSCKIFESSAKIFESSNFLAESSAILD